MGASKTLKPSYENPGQGERKLFRPRLKIGLETPIVGRYIGENKKLAFAPPKWYDNLVAVCIGGGFVLTASSFLRFGAEEGGSWRLIFGGAVVLAGIWAWFSNERLVCDLASMTLVRWEGDGLFKHIARGRIADLDAIVLIASHYNSVHGTGILYRLVLHWKGSQLPPLVIGQLLFTPAPGGAFNSGAGPMVALGSRYATSLQVKFFDNSYFHSPDPIRPV